MNEIKICPIGKSVNGSEIELQRIWTEVDVRNVASCRILEKCGYTKEGHIRQGKKVNTWCDYYIYGIFARYICRCHRGDRFCHTAHVPGTICERTTRT